MTAQRCYLDKVGALTACLLSSWPLSYDTQPMAAGTHAHPPWHARVQFGQKFVYTQKEK